MAETPTKPSLISRAFAALGFPASAPLKDTLTSSKEALQRAEVIIDPSRLITSGLFFPYNPSVLVTRKGLGIFDQMKMDEQVKIALRFKKLALLAPGWEIVSPEDQEQDWEVTTFIRDCLMHIPGGPDAAFKKMLRGLDYGYALVEKVYSAPGEFPWAPGKMAIKQLLECKPHYFDFDVDAYGKMLAVVQRYVPGQREPIVFPPDKFVIYSHDMEFENPYGRSDLEAAYRPWWVKDNAYKWLAVLLERYGMPPLLALYNASVYQGTQLNELKKIVRNIQNATLGLIPRTNKDDLEFWSQQLAAQGKEVFLSALGRFDMDIAKAVLAPSHIGMTTETKDQGSGGSLARSNVHFKMFLMVVRDLGRDLAATINSQLVRQLCDLNFAGLKSYPEIHFLDPDDETELKLFETWSKLVAGKVVNRIEDDERHIRKSLKFPENEDIVIEDLPEPGGLGKPGDEKEDGKKVAEEDLTEEMRTFAMDTGGEWVWAGGHAVCVGASA